jgi:hypothetical protein
MTPWHHSKLGTALLLIVVAVCATALGVTPALAANQIFWTDNSSNQSPISYANLDGSGGGGELNITGATDADPTGLAGTISYASLSGGGGGQLNITGTSALTPFGLAIDPVAGKVYWADQDGYNDTTSIYYANLNGSGGGVLDTTGATPVAPIFPVLLEVPSGTGVPVVSGGSTVGATLSCSAGTWASDLVGSFLYLAPRSFAYSCTLNGTAISGATSTTLTAAVPGQYV